MDGSARGLFATSGQGLNFRKAREANLRRGQQTLWLFAGLLADGVEVERAAMRLGKSPQYGWVLLRQLRGKLGWQAK